MSDVFDRLIARASAPRHPARTPAPGDEAWAGEIAGEEVAVRAPSLPRGEVSGRPDPVAAAPEGLAPGVPPRGELRSPRLAPEAEESPTPTTAPPVDLPKAMPEPPSQRAARQSPVAEKRETPLGIAEIESAEQAFEHDPPPRSTQPRERARHGDPLRVSPQPSIRWPDLETPSPTMPDPRAFPEASAAPAAEQPSVSIGRIDVHVAPPPAPAPPAPRSSGFGAYRRVRLGRAR